MAKYDNNLIVIGAGSAGLIAALIAATVKARVTLIEKHKMGGDCLNTGCVPSKTLIRSAKAAHEQRHGQRYGVGSVTPAVDFAQVMGRVREVIATIEPNDSVERYSALGVDCVMGEAFIEDEHHVRVTDANGSRTLSTRSIVLATGASPFVPPIVGLAEAHPLTSDNLWELTTLPERLLVMGGGPIGCELAQSYARLGSRVTLIDMESRLLPREDEDVSQFMADIFASEGIDVRLGHRAVEVKDSALHAETAQGSVVIEFDRILVAVGRRANSTGLGLESLGIGLNPNGTVAVDAYLRTACKNIFACGDLVGPYQFTHMASHQAWFATVNALYGRFRKFKVDYSVVPWATFTDPEIARVGLSESEAVERNLSVEVVRYPLADSDRAIAEGVPRGWVKVLVKPGSDKILGASIVGSQAGELITEYILAMTHNLGLKKIMGTIHIYPTLSEANKHAASAWRKAHVPEGLLRWVERLNHLLR